MKKLKVYVYAICKNESKYVENYVKSMGEADGIYVLDTGSTDDTVEKLKNLNVHVKQEIIKPFRFDVARNKSLEMVPEDADICVCTDFDEVFDSGWREKLESIWVKENPTRIEYLYNWNFDEYGQPATTFYISKIHKRDSYIWHHPVHEVLKCLEKTEKSIIAEGVVLNHHQDVTKKRSSYLPLLELSVQEDPKDDRNMHYLGREYMYYRKWNKAIDTLIQHLNLKTSVWKDERAASMRFISRSYLGLKRPLEAKMWLENAIKEAPYLREGYVELANIYYEEKNYQKAYEYLKEANKIKEKPKTYINESFCWNAFFYDMYSVVAFYNGEKEEAISAVKKAIELDSKNERLQKNLEIMKNA